MADNVRKEKIPNISEIFNADGSLNKQAVHKEIPHVLKQIDHHYSIKNGKASQTTIPGGVSISISFDRVENDPSVPAA